MRVAKKADVERRIEAAQQTINTLMAELKQSRDNESTLKVSHRNAWAFADQEKQKNAKLEAECADLKQALNQAAEKPQEAELRRQLFEEIQNHARVAKELAMMQEFHRTSEQNLIHRRLNALRSETNVAPGPDIESRLNKLRSILVTQDHEG